MRCYFSNRPYSGSNEINSVAWYFTNSGNGTKDVGTKAPNELNIYDMSGCVSEWCFDAKNNDKVYKGGGWRSVDMNVLLSQGATPYSPEKIDNDLGFRYACSIPKMLIVDGGILPQSSTLAGQKVQSFQIGRTEVTWGEWVNVYNYALSNGYEMGSGSGRGENHPVQMVSWYDALKWCNAKSQMEGLTPVYTINGTIYKTGQVLPIVNPVCNGYRLPLETEWEWAARGGVKSQGYTYSGSDNQRDCGWFMSNSGWGTKEVGLKQTNELGLQDMTGNVWEWCWDLISSQGSAHIVRGGSWSSRGGYFTNSYRASYEPGDCPRDFRGNFDGTVYDYGREGILGFRLAQNIGPKISLSGTLPEAILNQAYAGYTFGVVGSTGDKVWSISEGALPPGMSFSTNGTLSGTPTTAGTYTFVIRLESGGYWDEVEVELEVVNNVFSFNPEMVEIASAEAVPLGYPDFSPEKSVLLPKYTIAKDETTFAQWDYVVKKAKTKLNWTLAAGVAGSGYTNVSVPTPQHPVTHITFVDAVLWCNAASLMAGLEPCYFTKNSTGATIPLTPDSKTQAGSNGIVWSKTANGYRLPTGDEWEVAARGGLKSQSYPWGNTSANALNSNWVVAGGYPNNTTPVGTYPRNGFGLSDCAGNVLEMNWDTTLAPGDEVPTTLQTYVVRGGGWQQGYQPRIVFGYGGRPFGDSSDVVGFRMAKNVGTLFVEDFEATPSSSWKLSANGGGIYQTTNSTAQSGSKSLKLGIGQYQGGQNDSWASAQLSFPKPITNGSVEMYIYTQSNSPFYIYPHLLTESKDWDAGVWIVDSSNTISPGWFETLESQSTAQKITGWQRFKWVIANGKVELWIGDSLIGKAAYKSPPEGVEVSMTSYFVSNVSTYIDNVKVEIKNP